MNDFSKTTNKVKIGSSFSAGGDENLSEFDDSTEPASSNLRKYQSKLRKKDINDSTLPRGGSGGGNNISAVNRPHLAHVKVRNKNGSKGNTTGESFDQFVDLYVDGYIPCILIPPHRFSSKLIIYFHANAEDIGQSYPLCSEINDHLDCYVLIVEYKGYSIYQGSPTQEQQFRDTKVIWKFVTRVMNFEPQDVFIIGRSIGTGSALYLSSVVNPGTLCLISPFTSIKDVVKYNYGGLAASMLKERFNNKQRIKGVKCPVLFIHGKEDKLVPYKDSKALYGKNLVEFFLSNDFYLTKFIFFSSWFLELCQTPAEILIFNEMTHQTFDVTDCISLPLQRFVEKIGLKWKSETDPNIFVPKFAFACPDSLKPYMEKIKPAKS